MTDQALRQAIESLLARETGREDRVASLRAVGGGCINNASVAEMESGETYLIKTNASAPEDFFRREAEGLEAIRRTETLRAPAPIAEGKTESAGQNEMHLLILEYIESGRRSRDFFERLGHGLAEMHRHREDRYGLEADNYIGSTPQKNGWLDDWPTFFAERRLRFQFELMKKNGYGSRDLARHFARLLDRLDSLIGAHDVQPSCLHGDLWGGNFMCGENGEPVLIDPAHYYGDREADLAMTELFGGFDARFYAAYREAWPLADGCDARRDVYNLYHLMNHVNLFGTSYMSGVMRILQRYA